MHTPQKKFGIIGVPSDLGSNCRGSNIAPNVFRNHYLHSSLKSITDDIVDFGNISVPLREHLTNTDHQNHLCFPKNFIPILDYLVKLKDLTQQSLTESRIPLIIGGDHSLSIGSLAGIDCWLQNSNKKLGVLWLDAHLDAHTPETSSSQNLHGMPLSFLFGKLQPTINKIDTNHPLNFIPNINPQNCIILGARSIDNYECQFLHNLGVHIYTMADIDKLSLNKIIDQILQIISSIDHLHVSLDLDVLDPNYAPAVATAVCGGMKVRELYHLLSEINRNSTIHSMDVAEYLPTKDDQLKTLNIAIQLISASFSGINL